MILFRHCISVLLFRFLGKTGGNRKSYIDYFTGSAAGLSGAYHYRSPAVGDRYRGHEPSESGECTGDERPRHRSGGDVDILMLDKTGTITLGNRQADALSLWTGIRIFRNWRMRRSSLLWRMRRRKAEAWLFSRRKSSESVERSVQDKGMSFIPFHCGYADERRGL